MPDPVLKLSPAAKQWVATRILARTLQPWGGLGSEEGWVRLACAAVRWTSVHPLMVVDREDGVRLAEEYASTGKKINDVR